IDCENLVKALGNMKTQSVTGQLPTLSDFLCCQPAVICESKLQFVPVIQKFISPYNRVDRNIFNASNPLHLIFYLTLLKFNLFIIGDMLPFTTPTNIKML